MLLKVIAKYKDGKPSSLTLYKERMIVNNGEVFEVADEERANEILNATFQGSAVVEVVEEKQDTATQNTNTQDTNNKDTKGLDDMTVNELKELATQKGIELTTTKKADIINEIEAANKVNDDNKDNNNDEDNNDEQDSDKDNSNE